MIPPPEPAVFRSPARRDCEEHSLVLRALGIEHELVQSLEGYLILVHPDDNAWAGEQLALYREENQDWPPQPEKTTLAQGAGTSVAAFVATLLLFAWLQTRHALALDWLDVGRLQAGAVLAGEWWRTVTALTLHLDLPHLLGNLMFGALFGFGASQFLGPGVAWLAILLSGAAGNALNAFLQNPGHRAVGASTAVFGALGIVSLYLWRQRSGLGAGWAYRWAPVVGGVVLLAFLGVGGERTDVVAHLTGFFCGGLLGIMGILQGRPAGALVQRSAGFAAAALIVAAWLVAIARNGGF